MESACGVCGGDSEEREGQCMVDKVFVKRKARRIWKAATATATATAQPQCD